MGSIWRSRQNVELRQSETQADKRRRHGKGRAEDKRRERANINITMGR